jgi:hypothetical protein
VIFFVSGKNNVKAAEKLLKGDFHALNGALSSASKHLTLG